MELPRSAVSPAIQRQSIELRRAHDAVAGDVCRALARVQPAAARVSQADRALRTAIITFNGNLEGLRQTTRFEDVLVLVYRPQEAVYSLELMKVAFDEYFTTVAEYNTAQFDLFHALGYPSRELAQLRQPGELVPVDTARPSYLPPVGNGPPLATRDISRPPARTSGFPRPRRLDIAVTPARLRGPRLEPSPLV